MYEFEYQSPTQIDAAVDAFKSSEDGLFLAGGQTIITVMKQRLARPSDVIDLKGISDLTGVDIQDDKITIGAMTTHADVAANKDIVRLIPALSNLAGKIGDPQVRNRGTLGGSIANNDPAADYPAAIVGLGAIVHTNQRQISADDFFTDQFETALEPGELITKVEFPIADRADYVKIDNPASRFAIVGVFVAKLGDNVRVAVTGAGPCVFRVPSMETALAADFSPEALGGIMIDAEGLNSDTYGSPAYRAQMVSVAACRAVANAVLRGKK